MFCMIYICYDLRFSVCAFGAEIMILKLKYRVKLRKVIFEKRRGNGERAKHNLLCFSKSLFPRLCSSFFSKRCFEEFELIEMRHTFKNKCLKLKIFYF